jgi:hypothetical protein
MTGAFLNAIGILIGSLFGLAQSAPLSGAAQKIFLRALGILTLFFGCRLVWLGINGTAWSCAKQFGLALLAFTVGSWTGRLLGLQKISNRFGRHAGRAMTGGGHNTGEGFIACTILFCAAPLGLIGAVMDGLAGDYWLLAVKALMDALAMIGFVKMFGWPVALTAFPVYAFLGALTWAGQFYAQPLLTAHGLVEAVTVVAGMLAVAVAVVIFEVRKVELANYLPALVVAPLFTWLLH